MSRKCPSNNLAAFTPRVPRDVPSLPSLSCYETERLRMFNQPLCSPRGACRCVKNDGVLEETKKTPKKNALSGHCSALTEGRVELGDPTPLMLTRVDSVAEQCVRAPSKGHFVCNCCSCPNAFCVLLSECINSAHRRKTWASFFFFFFSQKRVCNCVHEIFKCLRCRQKQNYHMRYVNMTVIDQPNVRLFRLFTVGLTQLNTEIEPIDSSNNVD